MPPSRQLIVALLCCLCGSSSAGVMDNFSDGLKLAGQMFGINTAADVANLVAKAFSNVAARPKSDIMSVLQQSFQNQAASAEQEDQQYEQTKHQHQPENAQETPPLQHQSSRQPTPETATPPGDFNTGQILANMLRMVGFDVRKLGALAINALIMIAQAIGSSLVQATRGGGFVSSLTGTPPADSIDSGPEALFESNEHQPRSLTPGTPIDWFLQRPRKHTEGLIKQIMDPELPEHIVDMITESEQASNGASAACLKLLMCKTTPIIRGMQKSLQRRLNVSATQPVEPDAEAEAASGYLNNEMFFKYLPSLDEFRLYGETCESRFAQLCPRNRTMPSS